METSTGTKRSNHQSRRFRTGGEKDKVYTIPQASFLVQRLCSLGWRAKGDIVTNGQTNTKGRTFVVPDAKGRFAHGPTSSGRVRRSTPSITSRKRKHTGDKDDGRLPHASVDFLPVHHVGVEPANPEAVDSAERPLVPDVEAVVQGTCSENNTRERMVGWKTHAGMDATRKTITEGRGAITTVFFARESGVRPAAQPFDDKTRKYTPKHVAVLQKHMPV